MNLVSCYIENFGGLCQRTFDFDAGLTVIEQANGSGKTTLAAFIRCMLYGMPRQKRNDLNKDLRRRYAPWQGGAYGGWLVIHANKRLYRIERSFGSAPKEDVLAVYDHVSGRRVDDLGEVPGITLFGLDADSFERSAYIPQNRLSEALATPDIKAKLGNLVDNTDTARNYESAMKALRDARAKRVPYRGRGGMHADVIDQITQVSEELSQLSTAAGELERVRDREVRLSQAMDERQKHLAQVRADLSDAATIQAQRSLALECKRLDDERAQARAEYQACAESFSGKMPEEGAIQQALDAVQCLDLVKQAGISQEEIDAGAHAGAHVGAHASDFAEGDEAGCAAGFNRIAEVEGGAEVESSAEIAGGAGVDTADGDAPYAVPLEQKPRATGVILAVLGALLVLAGAAFAVLDVLHIASVFAGQVYIGAGLCVVGVVLCICGAFARKSSKGGKKKHAEETPLSQGAGGASQSIDASGSAEAKQRDALVRKAAIAQKALQRFCAENSLDAQVLTRDYLVKLREDARRLNQLNQRVQTAEQAFSQFVETHGLCAWRRSDEERFRGFNVHELRQREQTLIDDQDAALRNHANDLERIRVLQERVNKEPQLKAELENLIEQRKKVEQDAATLDATMGYLERAKDEMCENYAIPMQERFQHYLGLVMDHGAVGRSAIDHREVFDARNAQVDSDFSMTFSQAGATRERVSLSAGYSDLVMVCMRMALCDVLYEKEHPFIVMDDPFANVDDEMLQQAYRLLESLSQDHQIIYLTCSNSRNPLAG